MTEIERGPLTTGGRLKPGVAYTFTWIGIEEARLLGRDQYAWLFSPDGASFTMRLYSSRSIHEKSKVAGLLRALGVDELSTSALRGRSMFGYVEHDALGYSRLVKWWALDGTPGGGKLKKGQNYDDNGDVAVSSRRKPEPEPVEQEPDPELVEPSMTAEQKAAIRALAREAKLSDDALGILRLQITKKQSSAQMTAADGDKLMEALRAHSAEIEAKRAQIGVPA